MIKVSRRRKIVERRVVGHKLGWWFRVEMKLVKGMRSRARGPVIGRLVSVQKR